jgi:hypothetical protein
VTQEPFLNLGKSSPNPRESPRKKWKFIFTNHHLSYWHFIESPANRIKPSFAGIDENTFSRNYFRETFARIYFWSILSASTRNRDNPDCINTFFMPSSKITNYAKFENIFYHAKLITSQIYYHANFSRLFTAKHGHQFEPAKIMEPLRSSF